MSIKFGTVSHVHVNMPLTDYLLRVVSAVDHFKAQLRLRHLILASVGVLALGTFALITLFFWPRTLQFSYAGANCFFNPVVLPNLTARQASPVFAANFTGTFSVGMYPLYSGTTCVTLTAPPKAGVTQTVTLAPFGNAFLKKKITVTPAALPKVNRLAKPDRPVSIKDPLTFKLDQTDKLFSYQLAANNKIVSCLKSVDLLSCDLKELPLAQAATYEFAVKRTFNNIPTDTVFKQSLATVEPVQVTTASVAANETIYTVPADITLTLNKPAESFKGVRLFLVANDSRQDIPITTTTNENKMITRFNQPLPRSAQFEFVAEHITAKDRGYLNAPYSLSFKTSGGPKVTGVNIGNYKVAQNSSVTLTFDTAPSANQDLYAFLKIETGAGALPVTITARGKNVILTPKSTLPHCTSFTVKVNDGIQNESGITGGSSWQFASRTICQTVFSIGTSVQGRGITGYKFGNGPSKVIFVGTLHGDEKSATHTLNAWVNQLEANYHRIPAHRTIIVIPNLNPDGHIANTRTNANNIDLNRNFPANNWKSGITVLGGAYLEHGGGTEPLSEPESKAVANYILSQNPRLVLSYHAIGPMVIANESGDSRALATAYGKKSGFRSYGNEGNSAFDYDTTGAFEDWLHDKPGIPCLLIELATKSSNELYSQQNAMWAMAELP